MYMCMCERTSSIRLLRTSERPEPDPPAPGGPTDRLIKREGESE